MSSKAKTVSIMREFFGKLSSIPTYAEYIALENTPVRAQSIKRNVGSWARLVKLVGPLEEPVKEIETVKVPVKAPAKPVVKPTSGEKSA